MRIRRPRRQTGVTLVELAVTIAVLAIIAGALVPFAKFAVKRQKELELRGSLRTMRQAIDLYKKFCDTGVKFLRRIPIDPMTKTKDWGMRSYQDDADSSSWGHENVYDVYTTSQGKALDGKTFYKDW